MPGAPTIRDSSNGKTFSLHQWLLSHPKNTELSKASIFLCIFKTDPPRNSPLLARLSLEALPHTYARPTSLVPVWVLTHHLAEKGGKYLHRKLRHQILTLFRISHKERSNNYWASNICQVLSLVTSCALHGILVSTGYYNKNAIPWVV